MHGHITTSRFRPAWWLPGLHLQTLYYGQPISGTLWFLTLGRLFVGWIIDLFLIPGMSRRADRRYALGVKDYDLTWIRLTFNDEQRSGRV